MEIFTMNLFNKKLKSGLKDIVALQRFWKRDVRIVLDKKVLSKLKKICLENQEYEQYGHIVIDLPVHLEMIYDKVSLEIAQITIVEDKKRKVYIPNKRVGRMLYIVSKKK